MALTSFNFICFFAVLLGIYYLVPKKIQNVLLLVANMVFCYYAGGKRLLVFLSILTIITYAGALLMEKKEVKSRKWIFVLTVAVCMGILVVLKYINFFVYTGRGISGLFGISNSWTTVNIIAPLGISFFTLQLLGYFIDVQRGVSRAQKSFLQYALFATFFPQISSGPINRYADMEPQFSSPRYFNYREVTFGLQRMAWGFFKKLVISERMAVIVNTVYGDYQTYAGFYIVLATICFAFQLYTDFSGYMDIALGVAQALGIKMAENFQTPFFSRTISEYWRRWHITLGAWFKDYVFYPLLKTDIFIKIGDISKKYFGKKRGKKVATYLGMFILWFATGLWHGGSWNFIIGSGLLHWFYIVMGQVLEPAFKKIIKTFRINTDSSGFHLFQSVRTFLLVCIGFLFFRAKSFTDGIRMCQAIFSKSDVSLNINMITYKVRDFLALINLVFNGELGVVMQEVKKFDTLGLAIYDLGIGIVALGVLLVISILKEKIDIREKLAERNIAFRWIVYYILIFSVIILGFYGPKYDVSGFIYENF